MDKLDSFLLKKFQQFSDRFQIWLGLTNFNLAMFFITLGFACYIETRVERVLWQGINAYDVIFLILGTLFYFWITREIKKGENNCHQNPTFKSSFAVEFLFLRKVILFFFLMTAILSLLEIFVIDDLREEYNIHEKRSFIFMRLTSLMEFLAFYFASCTPKHKKPSKIRELIGKFSTKSGLRTQTV